jgi:hypothetical protein
VAAKQPLQPATSFTQLVFANLPETGPAAERQCERGRGTFRHGC